MPSIFQQITKKHTLQEENSILSQYTGYNKYPYSTTVDYFLRCNDIIRLLIKEKLDAPSHSTSHTYEQKYITTLQQVFKSIVDGYLLEHSKTLETCRQIIHNNIEYLDKHTQKHSTLHLLGTTLLLLIDTMHYT